MAITPNMANVDSEPIMMVAEGTGAVPSIVTLPTHAPLIDLRIGHPVLALYAHDNTAFTTAIYTPNLEQARTAVPGATEFAIQSSTVIHIGNAAGNALKVIISYIGFGTQQA